MGSNASVPSTHLFIPGEHCQGLQVVISKEVQHYARLGPSWPRSNPGEIKNKVASVLETGQPDLRTIGTWRLPACKELGPMGNCLYVLREGNARETYRAGRRCARATERNNSYRDARQDIPCKQIKKLT